jgi:hypothetical protein
VIVKLNQFDNDEKKKMSIKYSIFFKEFENEESMVSRLIQPDQSDIFLCGVSFLDATLENLAYKLRYRYSPRNIRKGQGFSSDMDWKTQFLYFLFPTLGPREKDENDGGDPGKRL